MGSSFSKEKATNQSPSGSLADFTYKTMGFCPANVCHAD